MEGLVNWVCSGCDTKFKPCRCAVPRGTTPRVCLVDGERFDGTGKSWGVV